MSIGIDIGGTNIKGVLLNEKGEILKKIAIETEDSGDLWKKKTKDVLQELSLSDGPDLPISISAPGIANEKGNAIAFMPGRLSGLEGFVWSEYLGKKRVTVLNDAYAALLAEATYGVGKGISHLVMLTLGTGVGGGILINGEVYKGFHGLAGHFGHISLNSQSNKLGITKIPGSLEDALSESSIVKRSHGKFNSILELVDAYAKGEHFATYIWLKSVRDLAVGISSICNILSPEMVIIGGGIANAEGHLFNPLNSFLDLYEWRPGGKQTVIKKAAFKEYSGAIGAATFAMKQ